MSHGPTNISVGEREKEAKSRYAKRRMGKKLWCGWRHRLEVITSSNTLIPCDNFTRQASLHFQLWNALCCIVRRALEWEASRVVWQKALKSRKNWFQFAVRACEASREIKAVPKWVRKQKKNRAASGIASNCYASRSSDDSRIVFMSRLCEIIKLSAGWRVRLPSTVLEF